MKQISFFYTIFWIIYFPTCLAFQRYTGIEWSDEFLCVVLMLFGFIQWRACKKDEKLLKEMRQYCALIVFYAVYSIFINVTTVRGIFLDFLQQIRPYMVFYMTMFLNPQFSGKQKKIIVGSMLITMAGYVFMADSVKTFTKGGEDGGLPMVALTTGMTYYLFMKKNKKNTIIAVVIMLLGLMSGKSKYMGQCVCFIGIVLYLKHKLNYGNPRVYLMGIALMSAVVFVAWTKFDAYYVDGMRVGKVQAMQARPATYRVAFRNVIWDYFPLGSGLGSFGTAAAAKEYSPLYYKYKLNRIWGLTPGHAWFLADTFYPTLAEFGVVGIFLFVVFWKRRFLDIKNIEDMYHYRMALMCILALAIDSTSNTAYLSGAGMGLFMTLAICLNSNDRLKAEVKRPNWMLSAN